MTNRERHAGAPTSQDQKKHNDDELLVIMQRWQELEGNAIMRASAMRQKTKNPFTKMISELIMHDSEKHRLVQQMIMDAVTERVLEISPAELDELSELIGRHVSAEEQAIRLAEVSLEKCRQVSTYFLLSYLIADEKKHHSLVERMDVLRLASISGPSAQPELMI